MDTRRVLLFDWYLHHMFLINIKCLCTIESMNEEIIYGIPAAYTEILESTALSGFDMSSEIRTCALLKTLAAAKPGGKFLELGTGTGLSTAWILDGMDAGSSLVSIDSAPEFMAIASRHLSEDKRLTLKLTDAATWIVGSNNDKFDFIFADTWHGKYLMLDEVLSMLNPGGFYIIDDMLERPSWPAEHKEKAEKLIANLESRNDLAMTKQAWATGVVIAVKI